jgi:hypothetical protein
VTKALRHVGTMPSSPGADYVQMARGEGRTKSAVARPSHQGCRVFFPRLFCRGLSAAHSCRRRRGSRLIRIGAPIQFAPIAWRAPLLPEAEPLAPGAGGSAPTARADYQPHSGRHPRPIGSAHTPGVQDSAVCAVNRFIALAGMSICGTAASTRMRPGTAPVSWRGNSGMRRAAKPSSCGACKRGAAAKPADGYGRTPRLTTASLCFGCGTNTETRDGGSCSIIGACQTFR